MGEGSLFFYDSGELTYRFHDHHPFNQQRLVLTADLLRAAGALRDEDILPPSPASDADLMLVHQEAYIDAVKRLSVPEPDEPALKDAERFGLTTEDTPYFPGMHEASARIAGGTRNAVDAVLSGRALHALHLGGGLHHALAGKAAGFCIYNDISVAIAAARKAFPGIRILYADTDVHHGDGVQWLHYTDPSVCTFSIHETGKYLFPGTGAVNERGDGDGFGANVNVPLEPYTEDASWLECFEEAMNRVTAAFRPDLILSQHGCDAHAFDPLSHIHCSMEIYLEMPRIIHRLAHRYCGGRWVALGGGGYDIWRVVPRAWSLLWLEMTDHPLVEAIRKNRSLPLPAEWIRAHEPQSPCRLPDTWLDPADTWEPMPRRKEIAAKNKQALELALLYLPGQTAD